VYLVFVVFSGVYYFAFFGLPQLLQEAGHYDAGLVGLLMLPLAAMSVLVTPATVRLIERFGVRSVLIAGALILMVASGGLGALTLSLWPPLVFVLTALIGVPYGVVSTASNQGLYVSARPEERGVAAGIFQTCRYLGAITATVLIGVLYGPGVNQANWGLMVLVMLGLGTVVLGLAVAWKRKGA
jgi:MFS family permease